MQMYWKLQIYYVHFYTYQSNIGLMQFSAIALFHLHFQETSVKGYYETVRV